MIWQYGNYKFNCNLQPPTVDKFKKWKDKFFKLENVDKYNVWLCGGFIEDWNTKDIDIVLNNKPEYGELKDIMLSAIKIGIDNNIFVDICHWNIKPLDYSNDKKEIDFDTLNHIHINLILYKGKNNIVYFNDIITEDDIQMITEVGSLDLIVE